MPHWSYRLKIVVVASDGYGLEARNHGKHDGNLYRPRETKDRYLFAALQFNMGSFSEQRSSITVHPHPHALLTHMSDLREVGK